MEDVVVVNHGKQFGHANWYTFYCPHCNKQVSRSCSNEKCCECHRAIKWDDQPQEATNG